MKWVCLKLKRCSIRKVGGCNRQRWSIRWWRQLWGGKKWNPISELLTVGIYAKLAHFNAKFCSVSHEFSSRWKVPRSALRWPPHFSGWGKWRQCGLFMSSSQLPDKLGRVKSTFPFGSWQWVVFSRKEFFSPAETWRNNYLADTGLPSKPRELMHQDLYYSYEKDETGVLACNVQSNPPPAFR